MEMAEFSIYEEFFNLSENFRGLCCKRYRLQISEAWNMMVVEALQRRLL